MADIIWQLFAKKRRPWSSEVFLNVAMSFLIDLLAKQLKPFTRIWFFSRGVVSRGSYSVRRLIWSLMLFNLRWLVKKTHQIVWDSLIDYGGLYWQRTLHDLEKTPNVAWRFS